MRALATNVSGMDMNMDAPQVLVQTDQQGRVVPDWLRVLLDVKNGQYLVRLEGDQVVEPLKVDGVAAEEHRSDPAV